MPLTAIEADDLTRMIAGAVTAADLSRYVRLATGEGLYDAYVHPNQPLRPMIAALIDMLDRDGTLPLLAQVLHRERPHRPDLRLVLTRLFPDALAAGAPRFVTQTAGTVEATPEGAPALQRLIRADRTAVDLGLWTARLVAIQRQVCRIEADQRGIGTGFLVGDGRVLTNWHVVEAARAGGALARLAARFDYARGPDGTEGGTVIPVAAVLAEASCAPGEAAGRPDDPVGPDQLDFALLGLATPTGGRGALALPAAGAAAPPMPRGAFVAIAQHPQGAPMTLAMDSDAVLGHPQGGLRLRYTTNTLPGSSGAPVLDAELNLVALHHLGDPSGLPPVYNQGIPIAPIAAALRAQGLAA